MSQILKLIAKDNLADLIGDIAEMRKQLPFATALGLNRTAGRVRYGIRDEMKSVFDRPTPFALNSVMITPATKDKQEASVWLKDDYSVGISGTPATRYIGPEIFGGRRGRKAYENRLIEAGILPPGMLTVPGKGAPLDKYGNISGGMIKQMLSGLSLGRDIGVTSNITARSKRRNPKRGVYFVLGNPSTGIYVRQGGQVKCFLKFVKAPRYQPRLRFFEVGQRIIDQHWAKDFDKAMVFALKTARAK